MDSKQDINKIMSQVAIDSAQNNSRQMKNNQSMTVQQTTQSNNRNHNEGPIEVNQGYDTRNMTADKVTADKGSNTQLQKTPSEDKKAD